MVHFNYFNKEHFTDRPKPAAGSNMRDKATVNRLKMYKSGGKAVRCVHSTIKKHMLTTIILHPFIEYFSIFCIDEANF